jgi:hypothetical protein
VVVLNCGYVVHSSISNGVQSIFKKNCSMCAFPSVWRKYSRRIIIIWQLPCVDKFNFPDIYVTTSHLQCSSSTWATKSISDCMNLNSMIP